MTAGIFCRGLFLGLLCIASALHAEAVSAEPQKGVVPPELESSLVTRGRALAEAGKLMSGEAFLAAETRPAPALIELLPPLAQRLSGREIAALARAAYVGVGWLFQCTKCSRWHANIAGGYAIANDTVVTAQHVLNAPGNMKPGTGYLMAVRGEDDILEIAGVLAVDAEADVAVLRMNASDLKPIRLAEDASVGDSVFCLSDPRGVHAYFSAGIVNRRYTKEQGHADDPRDQRLHVSTDWAQGSSGAAVLDERGNAVGHVSRIRALLGEKSGESAAAPSVMSLHEAIPASCVLQLIRSMPRPE